MTELEDCKPLNLRIKFPLVVPNAYLRKIQINNCKLVKKKICLSKGAYWNLFLKIEDTFRKSFLTFLPYISLGYNFTISLVRTFSRKPPLIEVPLTPRISSTLSNVSS